MLLGRERDLPNHLQLQNQTGCLHSYQLSARSHLMHQHGERTAVAVGDRTHSPDRNWARAALRWSASQRSLPRTDLVSYNDDSGDPMASISCHLLEFIHSFTVHMTTFYGAQSWESITCFTKAVSLAHIFWKDLLAVIKRHTKQ